VDMRKVFRMLEKTVMAKILYATSAW